MTKTKDAPVPGARYDFYRPHPRVTWKNEIVDPATGVVTNPPSMTKQSFAAECDINNILKQYKTTGMIQHINAKAQSGQYMDLPDEVDFQAALNTVIQGEEAFASLPSKLRSRFGNDPEQFLAFCADPANKDEMAKLGLTNPVPPTPQSSPPPPAPEIKAPDPVPGVQG